MMNDYSEWKMDVDPAGQRATRLVGLPAGFITGPSPDYRNLTDETLDWNHEVLDHVNRRDDGWAPARVLTHFTDGVLVAWSERRGEDPMSWRYPVAMRLP
jgi:hypothetical protein